VLAPSCSICCSGEFWHRPCLIKVDSIGHNSKRSAVLGVSTSHFSDASEMIREQVGTHAAMQSTAAPFLRGLRADGTNLSIRSLAIYPKGAGRQRQVQRLVSIVEIDRKTGAQNRGPIRAPLL